MRPFPFKRRAMAGSPMLLWCVVKTGASGLSALYVAGRATRPLALAWASVISVIPLVMSVPCNTSESACLNPHTTS